MGTFALWTYRSVLKGTVSRCFEDVTKLWPIHSNISIMYSKKFMIIHVAINLEPPKTAKQSQCPKAPKVLV